MLPADAIVEATVSRTRPVLMAALTTVFGSVPLLFDIVFGGMAATIVFGLSFATLLTLFVTPALCHLLQNKNLMKRNMNLKYILATAFALPLGLQAQGSHHLEAYRAQVRNYSKDLRAAVLSPADCRSHQIQRDPCGTCSYP